MRHTASAVEADNGLSVGYRISWGAVLAGAVIALAVYFLLSILGAAVGLSVRGHINSAALRDTAIGWSIVTWCAALFLGGVVTSALTLGENKIEAIVYGAVMWGVVVATILLMGGIGLRTGIVALTDITHSGSHSSWASLARDEGVPQEQIDSWQKKLGEGKGGGSVDREDLEAAAPRITWFAFAGTWASMLAAAAGAWLGAGPWLRVYVVKR